MEIPDSLWSRLPLPLRATFFVLTKVLPGTANTYRFNLFAGKAET
jgi:hypothetical protein